jgi:hypothetical protein
LRLFVTSLMRSEQAIFQIHLIRQFLAISQNLMNSEYRQRIIHHEAGHFLVAYLLDIQSRSVSSLSSGDDATHARCGLLSHDRRISVL